MSVARPSILLVTSECAPLVKTGGLADVAGSLPPALARDFADIRILLPAYRSVLRSVKSARELAHFPDSAHFPACRILDGGAVDGVPLLLLDCPPLFDRDGGPYQDAAGQDWSDNALRFGLFCRIAAELCKGHSSIGWKPQVVHCNDWQTGLVPAYLRFRQVIGVRSIFTIHNLAYQGLFPATLLEPLGLPAESFAIDGLEYHGQLSFLKSGLFYADAITTVSPTYAREIRQEPLGMGFQGLLEQRKDVLSGILNGIDTGTWNPARDAHIPQQYDVERLQLKQVNKRALQQRLGLATAEDVPLFGTVCRLAQQKGIDLIVDIADDLLSLPAQLVVCGTGDRETQDTLLALGRRHPGKAGIFIGYDEDLAHLIEAGADMFLMPSRFEPCGMNQMYSQRYGTVPIVHATGGLADSVVDVTPDSLRAGTATGFAFSPCNSDALRSAVVRAANLFRDPQAWRAIQAAGMRRDFSWTASATRYANIYLQLCAAPPGRPAQP